MKKEKNSAAIFEAGPKLPMLIYILTAVILSCVFILITMLTSSFSFTLGKELSQGDLNGDEKVNSTDVLYVMLENSEKISFKGNQLDAADINGDGLINQIDAILIEQYNCEISDKLGVLCPVNISIEAPSAGKNKQQNTDKPAEQTSAKPEFIASGTSYRSAFFTSESNLHACAKVVNKWQQGSKYMYQIEITIDNHSGEYIGSQTAEIEFGKQVSIEKYWDCYAESSDYGISVTTSSGSYTADGGTIRCGFIVSADSQIKIDTVKV